MGKVDLVDRYVEAWLVAEKAIAERDALAAQLSEAMTVGDVLKGSDRSVRKRDRAVLVPDRLRELISDYMWRKITQRKPVADLYNAEVKRGNIPLAVIMQSQNRSRSWLEVL